MDSNDVSNSLLSSSSVKSVADLKLIFCQPDHATHCFVNCPVSISALNIQIWYNWALPISIRETVHAHIYACYSHMCHSAHICEYDNWKFEDIWKKTVGENSSFYILLRN